MGSPPAKYPGSPNMQVKPHKVLAWLWVGGGCSDPCQRVLASCQGASLQQPPQICHQASSRRWRCFSPSLREPVPQEHSPVPTARGGGSALLMVTFWSLPCPC